MSYVTRSGSQFRYEGQDYYFAGFNCYSLLVNFTSDATITGILQGMSKRDSRVLRLWGFDGGKPPSNSNGNFRYESGGSLHWREAQWVKLDYLLSEAGKYGVKIYLCLADNNYTASFGYDSKKTYVEWANAVYGSEISTDYPYTGFFDSEDCRTILKDFIFKLANRMNTYNNKIYKEDDTLNFLDIGNEMRYDVFDAEGGTQNSASSTNVAKVLDWMDDIATYAKSVNPNWLITCSGAEHTWNWVQGDTVSNGSGYGRDYRIEAALASLDFIDVHCYPTQSGTALHKYGQRLGYPDAITGAGFQAQLQDYVTQCHNRNKPVVMGEIGFDDGVVASNTHYPFSPRSKGVKNLMTDWFGYGGNGMLWWSATITGGGTYSIGLTDTDEPDGPLNATITWFNGRLNGRRALVF